MEERKIEILESTQKGIIRWLIKQTFERRFIKQDRCWQAINEIHRGFKNIIPKF
jgi:hypothetical protein